VMEGLLLTMIELTPADDAVLTSRDERVHPRSGGCGACGRSCRAGRWRPRGSATPGCRRRRRCGRREGRRPLPRS
jgi:hypothetical protein